jgi:hypothetical protein
VVYLAGDELRLEAATTGSVAALQERPEGCRLLPVNAEDGFVIRQNGAPNWMSAPFDARSDGSRYVRYRVRANPRVDDPAAGR